MQKSAEVIVGIWIWKERDSAQPRLLEAILYKDNFNRAYKRVKANEGAPGIDGMTIEEALPYLKEHQQELILNSLALHWEGTEEAFISGFIQSHGRIESAVYRTVCTVL